MPVRGVGGFLTRRRIFVLLALAVLIPLLKPLGLPLSITPPVESFHRSIDDLPSGSIVLAAADLAPDSLPELFPMGVALMRHCLENNLHVVAFSLWPSAPPVIEEVFRELEPEFPDKCYGVDYVNLGYMAGGPITMLAMGTSIPQTFPRDYRGTPVDELPLMNSVRNYDDVALLVNISAGTPGVSEWVQQVQGRFGVTMVAGCTGVVAPNFYPYVQSGQLAGLLGGLKGAAEYEVLIGAPDEGVKAMDAQSIVHALLVVLIVLGNIGYLVAARRRRAGGLSEESPGRSGGQAA